MPRKTRSGRHAPAAPSKRIRSKDGCLTCRIRRKKCDGSRDHADGCETCARLHIECLGYSTKRPEWLKGEQVNDYKRRIKHFLADHNAKSSSRVQEGAFLKLADLRAPPTPGERHDSSASDSDPESDIYIDIKFPEETSPQHPLMPLPTLDLSFSKDSGSLWSMNSWDMPVCSPDADGSLDGDFGSSFPPGLWPSYLNNHELFDTSYSVPDAANLAQVQNLCVMMGQYDHWGPPLVPTTEAQASMSLQLHDVRDSDPEGVDAVLGVHSPSYDQSLLAPSVEQRRLDAMQRLVGTGYNKLEGRARISLWMMEDSLRGGHFTLWGTCLDLILSWMRQRFSETSSVELSSLDATEQVVLKQGIWSDIIAGATTGRIPSHIEWYRKAFDSSNSPILNCRNKDVRVFAEAVALASLHDHISSTVMAKLRAVNASTEDLTAYDDESTIKASIHRAGVALYLETVAHHGVACDPSVQAAVKSLCEAIGENTEREYAFWIFLAGCHAVDADRWSNTRTMMDMLLDGEPDQALTAASEIMDNVHAAREQGLAQSCSWKTQMQERGVLLV
ncbi:hypothetical protein BDV93DRAFT_553680 [Ceratobasidium sp. AG-I]|nr:hypothetical protein BDV93DRAFT_553680 [Ceratobasidium sp. AG-I]